MFNLNFITCLRDFFHIYLRCNYNLIFERKKKKKKKLDVIIRSHGSPRDI